jgi:hypothetical protein
MKILSRAAVLLALPLLATMAVAQVNGVPASVTSVGTPGRGMAPGVPASVTSLGPLGWQVPPGFATPLIPAAMGHRPPFFNVNVGRNGLELGHQHHLRGGGFAPTFVPYPVGYPVAYPYPVTPDMYMNGEEQPEQPQEPEPPGLTIFDRRPTTALQPDPPQAVQAEPAAVATATMEPEPEREQDPTLLIFKDGHRLEIRNFVIAGDNVIELTPEYRKIPLDDLDLGATVKENDARGVDFHVPAHKGGL